MIFREEALRYHKETRPGKIEITPTKPCISQSDLSLAYTPGVAEPCLTMENVINVIAITVAQAQEMENGGDHGTKA